MLDQDMVKKVSDGQGFIAALDQSGGSTPKALKGYGVEESAWSNDEEMFGLIHGMRSRVITSPAKRCWARSCSSAPWTAPSTASRPRPR